MKKSMLAFAIVLISLNFCACSVEPVEIELAETEQSTEGEQETQETDPDEV